MDNPHSRIDRKVSKLKFLALLREVRAGNIDAIMAINEIYGPLAGEPYPESLESIIDTYLSNIEAETELANTLK